MPWLAVTPEDWVELAQFYVAITVNPTEFEYGA